MSAACRRFKSDGMTADWRGRRRATASPLPSFHHTQLSASSSGPVARVLACTLRLQNVLHASGGSRGCHAPLTREQIWTWMHKGRLGLDFRRGGRRQEAAATAMSDNWFYPAIERRAGPPEVFSTTDWPTDPPALYENRNRSRSRSISKIGSRSIDVGKSEIVTGLHDSHSNNKICLIHSWNIAQTVKQFNWQTNIYLQRCNLVIPLTRMKH